MKIILLIIVIGLSLQKCRNLEKYGEAIMNKEYNCLFVYVYDDFYDSFSEDDVYLEVSYYWHQYENFELNYSIENTFIDQEDRKITKKKDPRDKWYKKSKTKEGKGGIKTFKYTYEFKFSPDEEQFLYIATDKVNEVEYIEVEHIEKYQSYKVVAAIFFTLIGLIVLGLVSYFFLIPYIKKKCSKSESQINAPLGNADSLLPSERASKNPVNE